MSTRTFSSRKAGMRGMVRPRNLASRVVSELPAVAGNFGSSGIFGNSPAASALPAVSATEATETLSDSGGGSFTRSDSFNRNRRASPRDSALLSRADSFSRKLLRSDSFSRKPIDVRLGAVLVKRQTLWTEHMKRWEASSSGLTPDMLYTALRGLGLVADDDELDRFFAGHERSDSGSVGLRFLDLNELKRTLKVLQQVITVNAKAVLMGDVMLKKADDPLLSC